MPHDPRYDILFEPVKIGPVTAKNRFYQVPHCNGMGYRDPTGAAFMRKVKGAFDGFVNLITWPLQTLEAEGNVLCHRHMGEQGVMLEHRIHCPTVWRQVFHVLAEQ